MRIGYVVKRYPRYSETFIVNEILAHERAGLDIEIFSIRQNRDSHFQDRISRVRAPVRYLSSGTVKAASFLNLVREADQSLPGFWSVLRTAVQEADVLDVYQAILLAREASKSGIDHLHAHFATSASSVARLAAKMARIGYSITAHAKDIFHESVQHDDLERKLRDATAVVTVSDFNRLYLREQFGDAAERVIRIYNGLDLRDFPYTVPRSRAPRIVAVGRLVEKKGFAVLVDACSLLSQRDVDYTCTIIGSGDQEANLRRQVQRLRLDQRVTLCGPRPQSEVKELVQQSAVLGMPCMVARDGDRDGLPTVLVEAMALGTPCVASDVTGISEIIRNGETGLLVPQQCAAELAAGIERLLNDGALRVRLAENARRLVETDFNVDRVTGHMRAMFAAATAPSAQSSENRLQEVH